MARNVGFFHNGRKAPFQKQFAAFVRRLQEVVEEDEVRIVEKWAGDDPSRSIADQIKELASQPIEVMVAAGGPPSAEAAIPTASKIPVVFTSVANPKRLGLVTTPNRPDRNMTGISGLTSELDAKRLEILREYIGGTGPATVGVLSSAKRPKVNQEFDELKAAAGALNLTLVDKKAADLAEIKARIAEMQGARVSAILVAADSLFNDQRRAVVKAVGGFPAIYQWREFPEAGGLMSFGPNILDAYRRVAEYVGFILDGEEVANLPISLPDRLELVINMKAVQADGFKMPVSILSRAEFVRPRLRPRRGKGASEAAD